MATERRAADHLRLVDPIATTEVDDPGVIRPPEVEDVWSKKMLERERSGLKKLLLLAVLAISSDSCSIDQPKIDDFVAGSRSEQLVDINHVEAPASVTPSTLEEVDQETHSILIKALLSAGDRMLFPPALGGMPEDLGINGLTTEQRVILESEKSRAKFFHAIEK